MRELQKTKRKNYADTADDLHGMDMSFQGLSVIGRNIIILSNIRQLVLNNNEITEIPIEITKLKCLEKLDLGYNRIEKIPAEIGQLVNLQELLLNDNMITEIPMEMGTLYKLETFNIQNNPLMHPYGTMAKDKSLLRFCRENNTNYPQPNDRVWVDTVLRPDTSQETFSFGSYNTLCSFYASTLTYAPSWVVNVECRKDILMQMFTSYNLDILGLQEVDIGLFNTFYKETLANRLDYEGILLPKKSYDPVTEQSKKLYGLVTFWKKGKFRLVDQASLDFYQRIINDKRFKHLSDIHTRLANKTNVGLVTVFEVISTGQLVIVGNVHLYWKPEYNDIKILQTLIFLEEIEFMQNKYKSASTVILGDFNSMMNSEVYSLIVNRKIGGEAFDPYDYGMLNDGAKHNIKFQDAYEGQGLTFTNFTPTFKEVIDYIFYTEGMNLVGVISPVEDEYTERTIGLPNIHFPSDHVLIGAKFNLKSHKHKNK